MVLANAVSEIWDSTKDYWIVPAGMIALYYYGWYHFNSPDYAIEQAAAENGSLEQARLLSPAPPRFTTSGTRFNRYARRYIFILEAAFVIFVFSSGLINIAGDITKMSIVSLAGQNLEYRAVWALFALTGLLSAFPGFKDLDGWILKKLHEAALIPDDARFMADRLYDARIVVTDAIANKAKKDLTMRDTRRVAEGEATGALEMRLLRVHWLRHQLQYVVSGERYSWFKRKLDRDIKDVLNISNSLRKDVRIYLLDQERIVPPETPDIDEYIASQLDQLIKKRGDVKSGGDIIIERQPIELLDERRQIFIAKFDALYYRLCLITTLMVFATERSAEATQSALRQIGFQVSVSTRPAADWHTVTIVSAATLAIITALNVVFAVLAWAINLGIPNVDNHNQILIDSVSETACCVAAIVVAMQIKKYTSLRGNSANWDNAVIALAAYAFAATFYAALQYFFIRSYVTTAPFLFALEQAVVGYFAGIYIDRALKTAGRSLLLVGAQAGCQFLAALIAAGLATPPGVDLSVIKGVWAAIIAAVDSAIVGAAISFLFQYYYQASASSRPPSVGHAPGRAAMPGDLHVVSGEFADEPTGSAPRSYPPSHRDMHQRPSDGLAAADNGKK